MNLFKNFIIAFVAIISIALIQSCDSDADTSRVQLKLIDAPGDYLEVNVVIIDVQYNNTENEEGWTSFEAPEGTDYPINIDLTELIAGNSLLLTDEIIPSGMMKQIRLVLGEGNTLKVEGDIVGEGELFSLDTPSALQSGLKLNLDTELEGGFSYTFILDWDVQESIVATGNSTYNLKPVIKANAEANSGSINGKVVKMVDGVETVLEGVTTIMLTNGVDDWNTEANLGGEFLFQGLNAGEDLYTVTIEKEGYQAYELTGVDVSIGNVTELGTIILVSE